MGKTFGEFGDQSPRSKGGHTTCVGRRDQLPVLIGVVQDEGRSHLVDPIHL